MKKKFKVYLALSQSVTLFLPAAYAFALSNPCDSIANKDAIHCAYIAPAIQPITGKYIKIKETQTGRPTTTKIFCAAPNRFPLKTIPHAFWSANEKGQNLSWQFSQCMDEDCSTSKMLVDDKFSITKKGMVYISGSRNKVDVVLDPNYGLNCKADAASSSVAFDSALQMRIDDATSMLNALPVALNATTNILTQMTNIAVDAASGTHSPSELTSLDKQFQLLKLQIEQVQRVNTLDGYKKISSGSIDISIGFRGYDYLQIPVPATDISGLGVAYLDVLSQADAQDSIAGLTGALDTVINASSVSLKK